MVAGVWVRVAMTLVALLTPGWLGALPPFQTEGTRRMAGRLEAIAAAARPERNPFLNDARARLMEAALAAERTSGTATEARLLDLEGDLGMELLRAGRSLDAIARLERVLAAQRAGRGWYHGRRDEGVLRRALALAWLRLGEQENCLSHPPAGACLWPLEPAAIHVLQRGSRQAMRILKEQLALAPGDLESRWLLNLAAMTVGDHPSGVPEALVIPVAPVRTPAQVGRFRNVAPEVGLDVAGLSGGCVLDDLDGDGDLDLLVSSLGLRDPLRFLVNRGNGTWEERTEAAGLSGETGGLNLVQADYDNDGWIDVLVLRGAWLGPEGRHPKSLLRNRGDGTFDDVTERAGLLGFHPTQTAVWLDYDGDGWLDVFLGHESREGDEHPCQMFRNRRDGSFEDVTSGCGLAVVGWVKGVTAGDYDDDGRPDLYVSRLGEENLLFHNEGPEEGKPGRWVFREVGTRAGVREPRYSFSTWFFDANNDGRLDLFVAGYQAGGVGDIAATYLGLPSRAERPRLYLNRGAGRFESPEPSGLATAMLVMGANFGDVDNDGRLDIYLGTGEPDMAALLPNRLFWNGGGVFEDVTSAAGVGHLQKGHAIAFGDVDEDGDQDIYADMGGAYSGDVARNVLFENPGQAGAWVKVQLEGTRANRCGIGARIAVRIEGPEGPGMLHRVVGSGGSFGASPLRQEIGLGAADRIESIEILWPGSGTRQRLVGPPMRCLLKIREGDAGWREVRRKAVRLGGGVGGAGDGPVLGPAGGAGRTGR